MQEKNYSMFMVGVWSMVIFTIFIILSVVVYLVGHAYVYKPIEILDTHVEPQTVCPGREVFVTYGAIIDGGPYTVERISGELSWSGVEDPRAMGAVVFDEKTGNKAFLEDQPYRDIPSPARRIAPTVEGDYYSRTVADIEGRMFGIIPVEYRLESVSDDKITVVPRDDELCKSERGEE